MIFLHRARLVILSQPKTGTTALDSALAARASMVVNSPPEMKHAGYRKYMKFVAPWIQSQTGMARKDYDVVCVMREPIDWLGSWYRYRTREGLNKSGNERAANYTGHISFDQFVQDACKPKREQPGYARMNNPCAVALSGEACIGVDRLFPYEDMSGLYDLIEERTGKSVKTEIRNVSPEMELTLSDDTLAKIRRKLAFAFDVHASLKADGTVDPRFRVNADKTDDKDEDEG